MSIIRTIHNKENPYVQLNKKAIWDESLSLKAVGLWSRCMSRPDNWSFNVKELASKSKEGRRAIDSAIKELIDAGYGVRVEHWEKSKDGKFTTGGVEYVFFEFRATEKEKEEVLNEFKKSFRHCAFGNRRNGNRRNSELLNREEEQRSSSSKKISLKEQRTEKEEKVPVEKRPLSFSKKEMESKKSSKWNAKLSSEEREFLEVASSYRPENGESLDPDFLTWGLKKYGASRMLEALNYCLYHSNKNGIKKSMGGLMRSALIKGWKLPDDNFHKNKRICESFCREFPGEFFMTEKYLTDKKSFDVYFDWPSKRVEELLDKKRCSLL